jgi:hypothetical protein
MNDSLFQCTLMRALAAYPEHPIRKPRVRTLFTLALTRVCPWKQPSTRSAGYVYRSDFAMWTVHCSRSTIWMEGPSAACWKARGQRQGTPSGSFASGALCQVIGSCGVPDSLNHK